MKKITDCWRRKKTLLSHYTYTSITSQHEKGSPALLSNLEKIFYYRKGTGMPFTGIFTPHLACFMHNLCPNRKVNNEDETDDHQKSKFIFYTLLVPTKL